VKQLSSHIVFRAYAFFLIVSGMAGTLLGPDHTKTAVVAGLAGGIGVLWLAKLANAKAQWAMSGLRAVLGVFGLTFVWRAVNAWTLVAGGASSLVPIAVLLSLMFAVTIVAAALVRTRNSPQA
jgi:apolipoprotein N-acyltransferase